MRCTPGTRDREKERLSDEDEARLSIVIQNSQRGSPEWLAARNELTIAHIGAAHVYAKRHHKKYPTLGFDDVKQAACVGLILAAERFDYTQSKFSTFCEKWMLQHVKAAHRRGGRLIRITSWRHNNDTPEEMESWPSVNMFASQMRFFDCECNGEDANDRHAEQEWKAKLLSLALGCQTDRNRELICEYFGIGQDQKSQGEIAKETGIPIHSIGYAIRRAISETKGRLVKSGALTEHDA